VHIFDGHPTLTVGGKRDREFAIIMQVKVRMVIGSLSCLSYGAHQDDAVDKRWQVESL
jgi:hypothetical protein